MKRAILGAVVAGAALVWLPGAAAAQCEGGTSAGGQYVGSNYQPGGCSFTSSTTPGQLYPSGAQPLPSTNPAQGLSALPGQPGPTGLLPVRGGDLGQPMGATGILPQTLGPGSNVVTPGFTLPDMVGGTANALPGQVNAAGLPSLNTANVGSAVGAEGVSNGLTTTVNNGAVMGVGTPSINGSTPATEAMVGPGGMVNDITLTRGLPNTTNATGLNSVAGGAAAAAGTTGSAGTATSLNLAGTGGTPQMFLGGRQPSLIAPAVSTSYGFTLPAAPAVSADPPGPPAPAGSIPPPAPGRGGPTFIGQERGGGTVISIPNQ